MPAKKGTQPGKKSSSMFIIDCSKPIADKIFDLNNFGKIPVFVVCPLICCQEEFLKSKIKVEGKVGNLGDKVKASKEGTTKLCVQTDIHFSKRYLKYLTKKYLKSHQLRDYLHVVASSKNAYEIRYFNISGSQ